MAKFLEVQRRDCWSSRGRRRGWGNLIKLGVGRRGRSGTWEYEYDAKALACSPKTGPANKGDSG